MDSDNPQHLLSFSDCHDNEGGDAPTHGGSVRTPLEGDPIEVLWQKIDIEEDRLFEEDDDDRTILARLFETLVSEYESEFKANVQGRTREEQISLLDICRDSLRFVESYAMGLGLIVVTPHLSIDRAIDVSHFSDSSVMSIAGCCGDLTAGTLSKEYRTLNNMTILQQTLEDNNLR